MALRTFSEIVNDLITYILRQNQKIDVSPGQVIRDASINSPAYVMADLYSNVEQIRNSQSILNANTMSTSDMDNLAANYGVTRKGSVSSQVNIIFYTPTQPNSDIQIPIGTTVGTNVSNGGTQVIFSTTTTATMYSQYEATYYNPNTGYWEISVPAQAQQGGSNGNVGPFTLTQIINFNSPFTSTNRIAATGGADQENNQDLAVRTINTFLGNNKGTKNGYKGTALIQPNILDVLVQGPGDPLMVRDGGQGGKVDVWVLTSDVSATEVNSQTDNSLQFVWNESDQSINNFNFNLSYLPVYVDLPLTVTATTGPYNALTNVVLYESRQPAPSGLNWVEEGEYHYTFNKDNNLTTGHSVEAQDYITWNQTTMEELRTYPSGLNTNNSLTINIDYSYDKAIDDLQTILNDDNNKIITADVLAKSAIKVTIDVQANVNLEPNYMTTQNTINATINNVITAVTNYIDAVNMGTVLQESDIVQVIHNVVGVDNVILNSIQITRSTNPIYGISSTIITDTQALANEYLAAGVITINAV